MFDKNVIYQREILETTLDYIWQNCGLTNDSRIDYPILMTEPLCNPNYCRGMVNELMFESYQVPSVCYAIDSLLALYSSNN